MMYKQYKMIQELLVRYIYVVQVELGHLVRYMNDERGHLVRYIIDERGLVRYNLITVQNDRVYNELRA